MGLAHVYRWMASGILFPAPDLSEPNYENTYTNTDLDKLN